MYVADVAQILSCCGCDVGSDSIPSLGTSIHHRYGSKKTKERKKKKKERKKKERGRKEGRKEGREKER